MITELLRRQHEAVRSIIYSNLYDFVKCFFGEEEAEFLPDLDFFIYFGVDFLLVEEHWMDEEGGRHSFRLQIDYQCYNEWFKGLNDDV